MSDTSTPVDRRILTPTAADAEDESPNLEDGMALSLSGGGYRSA